MTKIDLDRVAGCVWYVVTTEAKAEPRVAARLAEAGIVAYVPMATRWVRPRHRKAKGKRERSTSPAFSRYVFVGLDGLAAWSEILATAGVVWVISIDGAPLRVSTAEVEGVMAAEDMGAFDFTAEVRRVNVGDKILLTAGPLDGYTAVVSRVPKAIDKPVEAEVEMMGRKVATVVPLDKLQRLA